MYSKMYTKYIVYMSLKIVKTALRGIESLPMTEATLIENTLMLSMSIFLVLSS